FFYHSCCDCHDKFPPLNKILLFYSLFSFFYCLCSVLFVILFLACSALVCLDNSVCHLGNDQLNASDRVAMTRAHVIQLFRITVCITDTDQSDSKCVSFLYADSLFLRVNYEDRIRQSLHLFDTAEVLLQLSPLFFQCDNFLLRKHVECAVL